jgi:transcriptional regulator with XRE-family HTH domain
MKSATRPVGDLLRDWRLRRHLSQLDLATGAEISARHVSFMENGRARPSREMLLRLSDHLAVPLRERNHLLLAAGYAPVYPERSLDDPAMQSAREVVELVLAGHEPFPALAIDARWTLVAANRAVAILLEGIAPALLDPPVNVLRLALHPDGLAPRIVNLAQMRRHLLERLHRQAELTADPAAGALIDELNSYSRDGHVPTRTRNGETAVTDIVVPMRVQTRHGVLTFITTTTIFGTPLDVTLAELAIESFFPADPQTHEALRRIAAGR